MSDRSRTYTIVGIIAGVGLLLSLIGGAVAGGAAGYFIGRREAQNIARSEINSETSQLPFRRVVPELQTPVPDQNQESPAVPFQMPEPGALLISVTPDSPADQAGLQEGDIILEFGGEQVSLAMDLSQLVVKHQPGDSVQVTFLRDGNENTVTLVLGTNPDGSGNPYMGVTYRTYMPSLQPQR